MGSGGHRVMGVMGSSLLLTLARPIGHPVHTFLKVPIRQHLLFHSFYDAVFFYPVLPVFREHRKNEFFVKPLPFFCNRQVALMATPGIVIRFACDACLYRIAVYVSDKLQSFFQEARQIPGSHACHEIFFRPFFPGSSHGTMRQDTLF